jgi:hypothetical protein
MYPIHAVGRIKTVVLNNPQYAGFQVIISTKLG